MFGDLLEREPTCRCEPTFEGDRLVLEADDCPGEGRLEDEAPCRASTVAALEERDVEAVCTRAAGFERAYEDGAAALLVAAGRFADAAAFHDDALKSFLGADYGTALRPPVGRACATRIRNGVSKPIAGSRYMGVEFSELKPTPEWWTIHRPANSSLRYSTESPVIASISSELR